MPIRSVFLSYSRKQFYIAERLADMLAQQGFSVWLDVRKIQPGSDWQASIDAGLAACDAVVVLGSRAAYRSGPIQHEVANARQAGKPIYLAVIEHNPFLKELRGAATIIDCQGSFPSGVQRLATSLLAEKPASIAYRRLSQFSLKMPFGTAKYLQLIVLNLAFLLGTVDIIVRKEVVVHDAITPRLAPALVIGAIPVVLWLLSFAYSLLLLVDFRRQRGVSYLALELWPAIALYVFPILSIVFLQAIWTQEPFNSIGTGFGPYFNSHLAVIDRTTGAALVWQLVFLFSSWLAYLLFVVFTLRGWLLAACGLLVTVIPASLSPAAHLAALFIISGGIALFTLIRCLRGDDIPVAFGERASKLDMNAYLASVSPLFALANLPNKEWGMWLSPGAFPQDLATRHAAHGEPHTRSEETKTWRIHTVAADAGCARGIRRIFARFPTLRETHDEHADYHLALLSNKTPAAWVHALARRYPQLICIMVSSVQIDTLDLTLQQLQWIDYRQQLPGQIGYLAGALAGIEKTINATVPENFVRPIGPSPVGPLKLALRIGGVACVALAATAEIIALQLRATLASPLLIGTSLAVGVWAWWEAQRLQARNAYFLEVLFIYATLIATLVMWARDVGGALLPRETWVQNGLYNSALAGGVAFVAIFLVVPSLGFLVVAGIELIRKILTLARWLPGFHLPRFQRTLAVGWWKQLDFTYLAFPVLGATLTAVLVLSSPLQHPLIHEVDFSAGYDAPSGLQTAPDGTVWFISESKVNPIDGRGDYRIGNISPSGKIIPSAFSAYEPASCKTDCAAVNTFTIAPDGSLWYETGRLFEGSSAIHHISRDGVMSSLPLPKHTASVGFAFAPDGTVWWTYTTALSLSNLRGFIDELNLDGTITTYTVPNTGVPTALTIAADGSVWFVDDKSYAIGTITPGGHIAEYPLGLVNNSGGLTTRESLVIGKNRDLWFSDPRYGRLGHMTADHAIMMLADNPKSRPEGLTSDSAGGAWYLDMDQAAIGHIAADGHITTTQLHALVGPNASLITAPDGSVWVSLYNQIARLSPTGQLTVFEVPSLDAELDSLALGPRHSLWFSEGVGIVGQLTV